MKRITALFCALCLILGLPAVGSVGASAQVAADQTVVNVRRGDLVTCQLILGDVPKPVLGCDFSFYYDASVFELVSAADYTGSTNKKDWGIVLYPYLDGEVRGNWANFKGVSFSQARPMLTVNLAAKKTASTPLSYEIRNMFDDTYFDDPDAEPQIEHYTLTCTASLNKAKEPELRDGEPQISGSIHSFLGKSDPIAVLLKKDGRFVDSAVVSGNTAPFWFVDAEPGVYTVTVFKKAHVPRETQVAAGTDTPYSIALCPVGDASGDGSVTTVDFGRANAHARGKSALSGYEFDCADVNEDGSVTTADAGRINSHARGKTKLWQY